MNTLLNVPAQLCPLMPKIRKKGDQKSPLVKVLARQNTTDAKSQLPVGDPKVAKGAERQCQPCHQSGKHKEGIHLPVL